MPGERASGARCATRVSDLHVCLQAIQAYQSLLCSQAASVSAVASPRTSQSSMLLAVQESALTEPVGKLK